MSVTVSGQSLNKQNIDRSGDSVTYNFTASAGAQPASFKAAFVITDTQPYVFSNGGKAVVHGPVALAANGSQAVSKQLQVVQGTGTSLRLDLLLFISELDAAGNPRPAVEATPRLFVTPVVGKAAARTAARRKAPKKRAAKKKAAGKKAAKPRRANLSQRLRRHRDAHGMTQAEAARRAGLSASTISRLERGGRPAAESRAKIEVVLS